MHLWSPPGKHREQKDERHFLNHWTNTAISETHALNSPLLPNSQQNYQKDSIIWEICVIRKRRILVLSWWASLDSCKLYGLGGWIPWWAAQLRCREWGLPTSGVEAGRADFWTTTPGYRIWNKCQPPWDAIGFLGKGCWEGVIQADRATGEDGSGQPPSRCCHRLALKTDKAQEQGCCLRSVPAPSGHP